MERFWVYIDNKVQGPVEIPSLRKLSGFTLLSQVCLEGQETWRIADEVIEIKAYFSAPPRGSSLLPEAQPELISPEKNQMEMPLPVPGLSTEARVTSSALRNSDVEVLETLEEPVPAGGNAVQPQPGVAKESTPAEALRLSCATCGYKNPRDVNVCMKCGTPLKAVTSKPEDRPAAKLEILADTPIQPGNTPSISKVEPSPRVSGGTSDAKPENPVVEIPVTRILIILLSVSLAGGVFFVGRQVWKARHRHVVTVTRNVTASAPAPVPVSVTRHQASRRQGAPNRHLASALPGVMPATPTPHRTPKTDTAAAPDLNAAPAIATYKVLPQAYPLQHRTSAPVDSKYSVKHRGDKGLWAGQEDAAIQQAQSYRIYGGQRTIERNTEILMQVLRDREYSSAFESGKRLYLLNDVDWAASEKDGPLYEVQLTFSGGKEADGSPRAPLRFAFNVDLDRQTVEPGGSGTVRANTLRAYFDESRIPPEERRSVAKDTEELVKAAAPDASPLALDTISKHYAETYSYPALTRVANAYGLSILNKKLEHETKSINEVMPEPRPAASPRSEPAPSAVNQNKAVPMPSASGSIQYTMERGGGNERLLTVQAPSRATPRRLWETITSYDRFTQFVPDMLVSQREGQDGPAVIVHAVSLTRLLFFVFKINVHLRILEHPQQNRLEFERIAGDFTKFSGYLEIAPDPTGTRSVINLHVSLAPKGFMPDWVVRDMARKFVVPVMDAMRSQAEAF